jgi:hypothetical protein
MLDNPRTLCPGAAQLHPAPQLKLLEFKHSLHGHGDSRRGWFAGRRRDDCRALLI